MRDDWKYALENRDYRVMEYRKMEAKKMSEQS